MTPQHQQVLLLAARALQEHLRMAPRQSADGINRERLGSALLELELANSDRVEMPAASKLAEFKAMEPKTFIVSYPDGAWPSKLTPFPGWYFTPDGFGGMRHEKIPGEELKPERIWRVHSAADVVKAYEKTVVDSGGELWVTVPSSQMRSIENDTIERCAAALEQEAMYNQRVVDDPKDSVEIRARAQAMMFTKRMCATILRGLKT